MTEQDAAKLAQVRMGDRIEYQSCGALVHGEVVGWSSEHTGYPVVLVYGDYHSDRRVPLHAVLSRERPGQPGVVRFSS